MLQRLKTYIAKNRLMSDELGANLLEYLMLTCLIALVCFAAWGTFGSNINAKVSSAAAKVQSLSVGN